MEKYKILSILILGLMSGIYTLFLKDGVSFFKEIDYAGLLMISGEFHGFEIVRFLVKLFTGYDIRLL